MEQMTTLLFSETGAVERQWKLSEFESIILLLELANPERRGNKRR